VTRIVTFAGPESIWLLADRRLTYAHKIPKDDARLKESALPKPERSLMKWRIKWDLTGRPKRTF
jgi:hypothetical protein